MRDSLKSVRVGEWDIETYVDCDRNDPTNCAPPVVSIPIAQMIPHENYNKKSAQNDIALLRLQNKVEFNDFVQPICLPLDPKLWTKDYTGFTMDLAGLFLPVCKNQ